MCLEAPRTMSLEVLCRCGLTATECPCGCGLLMCRSSYTFNCGDAPTVEFIRERAKMALEKAGRNRRAKFQRDVAAARRRDREDGDGNMTIFGALTDDVDEGGR